MSHVCMYGVPFKKFVKGFSYVMKLISSIYTVVVIESAFHQFSGFWKNFLHLKVKFVNSKNFYKQWSS